MTYFRMQHTPSALYIRGIQLGLLPRVQALQPDKLLVGLGRGPLMYLHAMALLAAADLSPAQRTTIEESQLEYAQYASSHPLIGAQAYARLIPLLAPERQSAVRTAARPVLERADLLLVRSQPEGGSHLSLYRDQWTPLPYRELWRVITPETYPAWQQQHCSRMLKPNFWWTVPQLYRENLAQLHLLGDDAPRVLALALEGVAQASDGWVTTDREFGMGGSFAFTEADVAEADRQAGIRELRSIAPILPPELHPRAVALALELGSEPPDDLGAQLADPLAAQGLAWYHAFPEQPIPWLTVAEREPLMANLDAATRATHVATLVEAIFPLADAFNLDATNGHGNKRLTSQWSRLLQEDLPVAAPYLSEQQTSRLLALWGL